MNGQLPSTLNAGAGAVLLLGTQFAIVYAAMNDIQPEEPGRPSYVTALGYLIALVIYLGSFPAAVAVPDAVLGTELPAVGWGAELLAVLVVPAFLIFCPALKGAWHRPARGFWFGD